MANIHLQTQRPIISHAEFSHIDDPVVDKVDEINDQNYEQLLKKGYTIAEAHEVCHTMPKMRGKIDFNLTQSDELWN